MTWNPPKKILQHRERVRRLLESGKAVRDPAAGDLPIRFIEKQCRLWQGPKAGELVVLPPWQREFLQDLFGLRRPDGSPLWSECLLEVPRGQAKTYLASCIAVYTAVFGRPGSEIILAANSREQSRRGMYRDVQAIVSSSPGVSKKLTVEQGRVFNASNRSEIRTISKQAGTAQGLRPALAILDELHEARDGELHATISTAMGKIPNALFLKTTTSGSDCSGICYEQHQYCERLLSGSIEDDGRYMAFLIDADEELAWDSDAAWQQANPSADISVESRTIIAERDRAVESPQTCRAQYERYRLNRWIGAAGSKWLDARRWSELKQDYTPEDLAGRPCWIGVDLSNTVDLSAVVAVFPMDDDTIRVLATAFAPKDGIRDREIKDKSSYQAWERADPRQMVLTPGRVVDHEAIARWIVMLAGMYDVRKVIYDRWNSSLLVNILTRELPNVQLADFIQSNLMYHTPCSELERRIIDGKIHHDGNPCLQQHVANVEVHRDTGGKLRPVKRAADTSSGWCERIDLVVAMLMGLDGAIRDRSAPDTDDDGGFECDISKLPADLRRLLGA